MLAGGDLLAGAQTGTGKTAGFVLPILQRLMTHRVAAQRRRAPAGARADPDADARARRAGRGKRARLRQVREAGLAVIFGGVGIQPQIAELRRGVDILVATPGRLLDLMGNAASTCRAVEILVLDEADRMLDMGFIRDIKRILAMLPKHRQNLLFSATFSDEIKTLADTLLDRPAMIEVARRNSTVEATTQKVHPVDRDRKRELLSHLIKTRNWFQVLVFTRTKHGANKLAEQLNKDGITALAIHGNKSQGARTRALAEFKTATLQVLVATDIAARGIDIDQLPHVVNYDLPNVPEDYVHRIGRTGRAGATGEAISLVCVDEHAFLHDIERLIKREIPSETVPGFEPDRRAVAQPIQQRQQRGARDSESFGARNRVASRREPLKAVAAARAAPRRRLITSDATAGQLQSLGAANRARDGIALRQPKAARLPRRLASAPRTPAHQREARRAPLRRTLQVARRWRSSQPSARRRCESRTSTATTTATTR